MSLRHILGVFDHSEAEHGARLVLLVLAEYANEHDESYPAVDTIARRAKLSRRSVQANLRVLAESGEIVELDGQSRYKTARYQLTVGGAESAPPAENSVARVQNGASNTTISAPEPTTNPTTEPTTGASTAKLFEPADPVQEIFDHYRAVVPAKERSVLTPEVRNLIVKALEERPLDECLKAVTGLSKSEHHIDGGYLHIKYAVGKIKLNETAGDRIDTMSAKAPKTHDDGLLTVADVISGLSAEIASMVRLRMGHVAAKLRTPDLAPTVALGNESLRLLRERTPFVEPVFEGVRLAGWRRVPR
jgi:hypothetical protein